MNVFEETQLRLVSPFTRTLPFGTPDEVRREVERSIDILGPGGGHFLGPTNTIGPEVPFENLFAMHEYAQEYGRGRYLV